MLRSKHEEVVIVIEGRNAPASVGIGEYTGRQFTAVTNPGQRTDTPLAPTTPPHLPDYTVTKVTHYICASI